MSNTSAPLTPLSIDDSANLITSPGFPKRTPVPDWTFNPTIITEIQTLSNLIGSGGQAKPLPAGIKQYVIIGTGVQTLDSYNMVNANSWPNYYLYGARHVILIPRFQDGDGTVPVRMAQISTATATYYIHYQKNFFLDVSSSHADLTDNPQVQSIVGSILAGNPNPSSSFTYSSQVPINLEKGVDFTLHSNAQLSIVDSSTGDRLGYNSAGGIDETLGTGSFIDQDGIEYAAIQNSSDPLTVLVNGTSTGNFTLAVNYSTPNGVMTFDYPNIQVQNGTLAQLSFNTATISPDNRTSVPSLVVDSSSGLSTIPPVIESVSTYSTSQNSAGSEAVGGVFIATTIALIFAAIIVFRRRGRNHG